MKIYKTGNGFQCPKCLFVMMSHTVKESEGDYKIILECPNERCDLAGKKFEYPESEMVEVKLCEQ